MIQGAYKTWIEEVLSILWASRTTPKTSTGESSFSLTFGTKVVIPPEVDYLTFRTESYQEPSSTDRLRENLDFLKE
ncbi:hypothetical protein B296_00024599 [Ensete ventricosum]|uniref:Uncharacterized protein n=1 Tax=Ensete ventricosum TaxID=4639 RepID=A0A426ZNY1_ENSVE|nr:hypothetical protein B296_00024599 [Ensete ventricosum]